MVGNRSKPDICKMAADPVSRVMNFPCGLLEKATENYERRLRLARFQAHGLKVKSVCTGIDAPGEALRLLQLALQDKDAGVALQPENQWVKKSSWCDKGSDQQKFLLQRAEAYDDPLKPCLFTEIEEVVPTDLRHSLGMFLPPPSKTVVEREMAVEYYERLGVALRDRADEAYPRLAKSWCRVHQQECTVRQSRTMSDARSDATLNTSGGLPCIAFSRVGLQRRSSDPTEMAFQTWLGERRAWAADNFEDFFMFENTLLNLRCLRRTGLLHHVSAVELLFRTCLCVCEPVPL